MIKMKQLIFFVLLTACANSLIAQNISLSKSNLMPINVSMSSLDMDGKKVVRVVKDSSIKAVDEPTFVRITDSNFSNGIIELNVLSKLLPNAPDTARGFIGIAFHINEDNTKFEGIYLRPTNARAAQQIRRNHTTQYFSYPNYKYNTLRTLTPGVYESYADMDLNQWIKMKIIVKDAQALLYLHNNLQPSLIVNDLKLGATKGAIGLFVDIGTEGFFADLKVIKEN